MQQKEVRAGRSGGQTRQPVNPVRRAPSWHEAAGWPASLAWIYEFLSAGPTGHAPYMSVRLLSHLITVDNLFFLHCNFCSSIILSGHAQRADDALKEIFKVQQVKKKKKI